MSTARAVATPPLPPRSPTVEPVTLYKIIMTPVNFVSFLVSLVLVDIHYTRLRMHGNVESRSRLPSWLHDLLFYKPPYEDLRRKSSDVNGSWYYHSKQKKILRMEAEDAFQLRSTVLAVLAVVAAAGTTALLYSIKLFIF